MNHNNKKQRKRLIITGSDAQYYPLLQELLASLRQFSFWDNIDIACLDGGFTQAQRETLSKQNILVKEPMIPPYLFQEKIFQKHLKYIKKRPNLAINLSKLWLDHLFPNYDTLLWLDSDIWIQDDTALHHFFNAAENTPSPLAIVPEIFTHKPFRVRWFPLRFTQIRSILYKNARIARLPSHICKKIGTRPTLNSGAFALATQAAHWKRLRFWQKTILHYGKLFSSDQLAKALCIYHENMPIKFLPVRHNYMGPWYYNSQNKTLCEELYPHLPISLIHLAGLEATRHDPHHQEALYNENGEKIWMPIRYSQFLTYKNS